MRRSFKFVSLCMICLILAFFSMGAVPQSGFEIPSQATGDLAYQHVEYISEVIGARVAGSAKEVITRNYIAEQFASMGYQVVIQPFSYVRSGTTYHSANVIATRPGKFDQTVIVGAHYDSVSARTTAGHLLTGAGDNASGVGVMLEVAEILSDYKTLGTIKFIAFGAEEVGLRGSYYYTTQMSTAEIENTVTMINLDCVGMGDFFYVYSGLGNNPGWARDLALKIGQGMGLDLRTSPQSQYFAYGTTGDWSDHRHFKNLGIPIAYFEWMNWDIYPNGGLETAQYGMIMHTGRDNLSFIQKEKLEQTSKVVAALTFELSKTKLPSNEKGRVAQGNSYTSIGNRPNVVD